MGARGVKLQIGVTADKATGHLIAAYFRLREGEVAETREIVPGLCLADFDDLGILLSIELLGPCTKEQIELATSAEEPPVKMSLWNSIPRELACC